MQSWNDHATIPSVTTAPTDVPTTIDIRGHIDIGAGRAQPPQAVAYIIVSGIRPCSSCIRIVAGFQSTTCRIGTVSLTKPIRWVFRFPDRQKIHFIHGIIPASRSIFGVIFSYYILAYNRPLLRAAERSTVKRAVQSAPEHTVRPCKEDNFFIIVVFTIQPPVCRNKQRRAVV